MHSKDSIKYKVKKQLFNLNRNNSILTQTPQAFKFKDLYYLSNKQLVEISIFDILGRRVKTLINEIQDPGTRLVKWDGKDEFGNDIGTGMYFYSIKTGEFRDDKKMILIK